MVVSGAVLQLYIWQSSERDLALDSVMTAAMLLALVAFSPPPASWPTRSLALVSPRAGPLVCMGRIYDSNDKVIYVGALFPSPSQSHP